MSRRVHVVGAGLIGTSVGLALRGRADVLLSDSRPDRVQEAVKRGAGQVWDGSTKADLLLACVPPRAVAGVISDAIRRGLALTYSHVASAQSLVQAEIEASGADVSGLCGGHPLAGRESAGPAGATARLFVDRPWVLCPAPATSAAARGAVAALAVDCGAVPVDFDPEEHDAAVALTSHLPQLAASAVAARLLTGSTVSGVDPTQLAGPGIHDTTRIAASDADLWVDVLTSNAGHVAPLVAALAGDLAEAAGALRTLSRRTSGDPDSDERARAAATLRDLLERGAAGRSRLPLKRRDRDRPLRSVLVSVPDQPGQLAGVLTSAAQAHVNVEDVRVEHLPGRPRGLVELLVADSDAASAGRVLREAGWEVVDAG